MTRERFHAVFLAAIMLLSVVAMGAGFAGSAAAQSDQIVVDQTDGDGADYTTIQEAVDNAEAGDTILVRNGTYDRFNRTDIDYLTITAAEDASPTISVSAGDLPDSGRIIDINGEGVEFSNISIEGPGRGTGVGVRLGSTDNTNSSEVSGVSINNVLTGIQTGDVATNARLVDNNVSNAVVGISLQADSATVSGNELTSIQANEKFPGEAIGIVGTDHTIKENTISTDRGVVDVRIYNSEIPTINGDSSGDESSLANTVLDVPGISLVEFYETGTLYGGPVTIDDTSYTTIEDAAGAAENGDTIVVSPGTYHENVSINTPNVSIVGQGDDTVINGLVYLNEENVTLGNVAVEPDEFVRPGGEDGIPNDEKQAILITASNVTVYDSTVNVSLDANGGFEEVNAIQVFGANQISDVLIVDNEITGTATNASAAGVVGVSDQAETNDTFVHNNTIDVDADGYSFGVVTRASNGTNVDETPTTVVTFNDISATADTAAFGIGYGIESSSTAQVDADAQLVKDNTFVDVGSIAHKAGSGTLDLTMNEWNDLDNVSFITEGHKYKYQNGGEIDYDPFLTSSPNASDFTRPGERTDFGHDLVVPADGEPHSVAFPAPVEGDVSEVFGDFNGTVYAYDGDEWESGEEIADEDVDALDAFVVTVDEDEDFLRIDFEYAESDDPVPSMTTTDLEAGWNFVGAPTGGTTSDEAFAGSTADVTTVIDALAGQQTLSTPYGLFAAGGVSNPDRVSPFKGYWVFVTDDGELGATVPVDPTQETEEGALTGN